MNTMDYSSSAIPLFNSIGQNEKGQMEIRSGENRQQIAFPSRLDQ